jgi:uracil-DNA glycosylase
MANVDNYVVNNWSDVFGDNPIDIGCIPIYKHWKDLFGQMSEHGKFKKINKKLNEDIKNGSDIFPYPSLLYNAFNCIALNDVDVVFVGQDPYFNAKVINDKKIPQANGMSFSVPIGMSIPSSLEHIYDNQLKFGNITHMPTHGNLETWASQGCLMINTSLTVKEFEANSHSECWREISDKIIKHISSELDGVTFALWGGNALEKISLIDLDKHFTTISSHPSGLSCNNPLKTYGAFKNVDHFGIINQNLIDHNREPIKWQIV